MHTSRKEAGMKILVNSMARLNFSSPRSFKLKTREEIKAARVRSKALRGPETGLPPRRPHLSVSMLVTLDQKGMELSNWQV